MSSASKVLLLSPTYGEYEHILTNVIGVASLRRFQVTRENKFVIDMDKLIEAAKEDGGVDLIILCNPNSPTGIATLELPVAIKRLQNELPECKVWVDETYIDFLIAEREQAGGGEEGTTVVSLEPLVASTPYVPSIYYCLSSFLFSFPFFLSLLPYLSSPSHPPICSILHFPFSF